MRNFEYKKSLGQNFLKDKNIIEKIVNCTSYTDKSLAIEIGPGAGALSSQILRNVNYAILYEIDTRLRDILRDNLSGYDNYELIFDDFLNRNVIDDIKKYDYDKLLIIANLPYYITTPIIRKIIDDKIPCDEVIIMIQKEVADRLSSLPGSREYGEITVFLNYFYDITKVVNVSKNSFIPRPKVDSAVIKMVKRDNLLYLKDFSHFEKLIKDSFRFKRKNIKNNLSGYDLAKIDNILKEYGYDINCRSEELPYYVFVKISNELVM